MLDDTCYFLACSTAAEAAAMAALCNDPVTLDWLRSASFTDAKRPITKGLLQRLDLGAILDRSDRPAIRARAAAILAEELDFEADGTGLPHLDRIEEALSTLRQGPRNFAGQAFQADVSEASGWKA